MNKLPKCPECKEDYTYEDAGKFICPMCSYEWQEEELITEIKDVNGNVLQDGDSVTVVKDLKVKGASGSIKIGTKVKNIRL
ncbi:MAG: zinc ribbon domain-containing protein YjdM, partial [Mycoplasmatales bacterium]